MRVLFTLQLVALFGAFQIIEAKWKHPCNDDDDCQLQEERCLNMRVMGCSKGYCGCIKGMGYDYNGTNCVENKQLALGETCYYFNKAYSKDVIFEKHVPNAVCGDPKDKYAYMKVQFGISLCDDGFSQSGSSCVYNVGRDCGKESDCGTTAARMSCISSKCQCNSAYKLSSKTGMCEHLDAGDLCVLDEDCSRLGQMLQLATNSYKCVNKTCSCSSDYQLAIVNEISFNEPTEQMNVNPSSFCFPNDGNHSFDLGANSSCRVYHYSPPSTKFAVCEKNYGCFFCPEDRRPEDGMTYTCRKIPPPQSSVANTKQEHVLQTMLTMTTSIWLVVSALIIKDRPCL